MLTAARSASEEKGNIQQLQKEFDSEDASYGTGAALFF